MECPWDGSSLLMGLRPRNAKECPMSTRTTKTRSSSTHSPKIVASLCLADPNEREAHDLLRHFCTGRWPMWSLLGLRREGLALHAAVEWLRCRAASPYSVVQIALDGASLRWEDAPDEAAVRIALDCVGTQSGAVSAVSPRAVAA
jgi:hypothetical protein